MGLIRYWGSDYRDQVSNTRELVTSFLHSCNCYRELKKIQVNVLLKGTINRGDLAEQARKDCKKRLRSLGVIIIIPTQALGQLNSVGLNLLLEIGDLLSMSGDIISYPSAHTLQRIKSLGRGFDEVIDFGHHSCQFNLLILQDCELSYHLGMLFLHDVLDLRNRTSGTLSNVGRIVDSGKTAAASLVIPVACSACSLSIYRWNRETDWERTVVTLTVGTGAKSDITNCLDNERLHILLSGSDSLHKIKPINE